MNIDLGWTGKGVVTESQGYLRLSTDEKRKSALTLNSIDRRETSGFSSHQ